MSLTEISVRGVRKPIVRYVYLVQEVSDAARMGGTSDNTYTTYQAAYNAADALQILLGGTNRVGIMVGTTTAAGVGSCSTPTWNSNVFLIGTHRLLSAVSTTVITTTAGITLRAKDITMSTISSEGGININLENSGIFGSLNTASTTGNAGPMVIAGYNSSTGNLGATSTAGASGNILINSADTLVVGNILQTSSLGSVGTLGINGVNNSTFGAMTRTATDPVGNWTVGQFSMTNSKGNSFTNITTFITNPASTGTIEVFIGRTNQSNVFNGTVTIQGCPSSNASDAGVDLQFINCSFNQPLLVNTAGSFITKRGGWIKRLDIQNCQFFVRARFNNFPINPQTTDPILIDLTVNIKNCTFFPLALTSGGLYFQNNDVSYTTFLIKDVESNDFNVGVALTTDQTTPPVVTWMLDGSYMDIQNIKAPLYLGPQDPIPNSAFYNAIIENCNGAWGFFEAVDGDFNFQINMCNFGYVGYGYGFGLVPHTKPFYINNSRMPGSSSSYTVTSGGVGSLDFIIKNSYFGYWTDVLNPQTVSMSSVYNSFVESIADVGSTSAFTGTMFTSTIRRLLTETVAGLTLNNSYDDPY